MMLITPAFIDETTHQADEGNAGKYSRSSKSRPLCEKTAKPV